MWVVTMFDLPTDTKQARRAYRLFRNALLLDGFMMMQFSVYVRHCPSQENANVHVKRIKAALPPNGEVRVITITDKQFERMKVFAGKIRSKTERAPKQLEFF